MKIAEVRLFKDSESSFIYHHETEDFSTYHHHPEYELVLITKGKGIRIVGDTINEFEENDLVFLGPYLPHVWKCDEEFHQQDGTFVGEGLVIQFLEDFLGKRFFEFPENLQLKQFFAKSSQGCLIQGQARKDIINIMLDMKQMTPVNRLYALFNIFEILATTSEFSLLCSSAFLEPYKMHESEPLRDVIEYMLKNFKKNIQLKDVLEIANMSNTQFFLSFKKMYKMPFKSYLLNMRIGFACRLLAEERLNISQVAYESGFENLSNFNRHFKQLKGVTPREYIQIIKN
ncbi:MAG: AraC family transcriptional regulator [Cyclobacteriaceae bacterium]